MRQVSDTDTLLTMYEYSYIYQYTDEEGRKERMKAQIDREQTGEQRVGGVKIEIAGRIRGANRAGKKVKKEGRQRQQDRLSRIELGAGPINTRYGTLGVKVQSAKERREELEKERITKVNEKDRDEKKWGKE